MSGCAMEDGGVLVLLGGPEADEAQVVLVRYAPDGMVLWSRRLGHACEPQLFSDGLLWLSDEEGFFSIGIQGEEGARIGLIPERHIDRERNCIVKYTMLSKSLPGEVWLLENSFDMGRESPGLSGCGIGWCRKDLGFCWG